MGREKEGDLATTSLEFEFQFQFPSGSRRLSCQISANQCEAETNANVKINRKIRAQGIDVITNVISANQHLASTFSMHIFKFQRRTCSCKLSYFSRPAARAPRRAYSQANPGLQMRVQFLHHSIRVVCRHGRTAIFKNTCIMRIASKPVGLEKKGNLIKN